MWICPKCKKEIDESSVLCYNCGTLRRDTPSTSVRPTSAGSTLDILGMVVIVFGALSAVVLFITTALVWEITSYKSEVEDFSWNGFVLAVGTLLSSLAVGYLLKTIAGIAKDVRTLAEKK